MWRKTYRFDTFKTYVRYILEMNHINSVSMVPQKYEYKNCIIEGPACTFCNYFYYYLDRINKLGKYGVVNIDFCS